MLTLVFKNKNLFPVNNSLFHSGAFPIFLGVLEVLRGIKHQNEITHRNEGRIYMSFSVGTRLFMLHHKATRMMKQFEVSRRI